MELLMDDMMSTSLFHVIDAKTSYNMLLGCPWLHEHFVVPSTWHQCFKYCRNGTVRKVLGDSKSFIEVELHFVDAKYYIEDAKKGKEINMKQPSKPPPKGFVLSTQEEEGGHEALVIDKKGFDPKTFKLLIKAGYNLREKLSLGKLPPKATGKKFHGLNATQIGPRKRAVYQKKCMFKMAARSKNIKSSHTQKLRSLILSSMRRQPTLAISCGKVLKVKTQTMIFMQAQYDEDDRKSVTSSNYISSSGNSHDGYNA
ncbi:hypothetical protein Sango_1600400 [Sesamum angolense]|uniref:Uncharacterized protein n=1 Tax=Sesamum angolense TaxID=2727404 RepID=A0AAE2BQV8_9LAMI|nr:hypothetical protein Sango_1600400 [Sesamum angolense]